MPRQNRVTPAGDLVACSARGTMFGNRGVLHDASGVIVRRGQVRRWIVCELSFRGRRREIMAPNRYTELFFLDEAVALAAGHRPCAECRNADYRLFRSLWVVSDLPRAEDIDAVLAAERALVDGRRQTWPMAADKIPRGVFVEWSDSYWLVNDGLIRWNPSGYTDRVPMPTGDLAVLTPPSTVAVIAQGYRPRLHGS
ncbi:hypothetical protein [Actinokineospora enzanensis]|uniref:hypothetical protein n=1 Tax=Actinokineospora enzanensis TaxID=155975 RepID=UPI000475DD7A|nr:hypothetical protein [Actinokineospora enzanensis]